MRRISLILFIIAAMLACPVAWPMGGAALWSHLIQCWRVRAR